MIKIQDLINVYESKGYSALVSRARVCHDENIDVVFDTIISFLESLE